MTAKIPDDAFERYYAQGASRSYQALADELGVSKRAVANRARKEGWQRRITQREAKTREAVATKVEETLETLNARHLRVLKAIQAKSLEALRSLPMNTAMDAVRALDISIRQERLIFGEPSDRTAISVEETIRREFQSWMVEEDDA